MTESYESISLPSRLTRGSGKALLARVTLAASMVVGNALITRLLPPEDAATAFLILSLAVAGGVVGTVGLDRAATRAIASGVGSAQPGIARRTILLVGRDASLMAVGITLLFTLGPTRAALGQLFPGLGVDRLAPFLGLLIAVRVLGSIRAEALRGLHEVGKASLFVGADAGVVTVAALAAVLVVSGSAPLTVVVSVHVGAWIPGLLVGWAILANRHQSLGHEGTITSRELFFTGWPIAVHGLAAVVTSHADLWVVGAALEPEDVAAYAAAARLAVVVGFSLQVVNSVLPPVVAELKAQKATRRLERAIRISATAAVVPAFVVTVVFLLVGDPILRFIFGDFYGAGAVVLAILSIGQLVNAGLGSCQLTLMMTGHERIVMAIAVVSATLTIAGELLVVDRWGAPGVAMVATVALGVQNVAAWTAVARLEGLRTHAGLMPLIEALRYARTRSIRALFVR